MELQCTADELNKAWGECKNAGKLVKFGGGFYCGLVQVPGKTPMYVFNGFFMSMRSTFTAPGRSIHYFTVEWDKSKLSWADFRGKVLGPTDPKEAPADSLRGAMLRSWKDLGLSAEPNVGNNGVHASASPFEGLAERMNWLQTQCSSDSYCKALVRAGMTEDNIRKWSVDPQVITEGGKTGSLFDAVEDLDAGACRDKLKRLQGLQPQ